MPHNPPALSVNHIPAYVVIYHAAQWAILKARRDSLKAQAESLLNQRRALLTEADSIDKILQEGKNAREA